MIKCQTNISFSFASDQDSINLIDENPIKAKALELAIQRGSIDEVNKLLNDVGQENPIVSIQGPPYVFTAILLVLYSSLIILVPISFLILVA